MVKKTTDQGIVIVGRETGKKDREWAFVLDAGTRIDAGGQARGAGDLRKGDPVTVSGRRISSPFPFAEES